MPRKCIVCGKDSVVFIPYARAAFCREHFISFYERRILKTLKKAKFDGGRVLVGVSGGKDSMALIYALNRLSGELNIDIFTVHIDLGIYDYSKVSKEIVENEMSRIGVKYEIVNVRDYLGVTIPEAVKKVRRPACSVCGIVKRWILNKIAYDNSYEYIATGHNIDDVSTYFLKALFTQRVEDLMRGHDIITPPNLEYRMIGRIRPQVYLSERENQLYCIFNDVPFVEDVCPLARGALLHKYKRLWEDILQLNPIAQINLTKTIMKLREKIPQEKVDLQRCKICGFATTSKDGICAFCKLKLRIAEER